MAMSLDFLFFLGRPVSPIYGLAMRIREKMYKAGIFRQYSLQVPVISVGNLVLGGTGKTPTVQHITRLLMGENWRPAIISRGYGGEAKQQVNVVSDGNKVLLSPVLAGDEPYMLANSLPGVPVLTGTRRIFPCRHAIDAFNADIIVLDDGFQHLSVKRDIDIVLFDGTLLAGNSRIFPGGPLREPISALNRCQSFLITGTTETNLQRSQRFSKLLNTMFSGKPVHFSSSANYMLKQKNKTIKSRDTLTNVLGFCGIANPLRFKESLLQFGTDLVGFESLKDHTKYNQSIVTALCQKAIQCGADKLITTEKDLVKLENFEFSLPLYVLEMQTQVDSAFNQFLISTLDAINQRNQ